MSDEQDDGGMRWWAEVGQYEEEQQKAETIKAHRRWPEFNNQEKEHGNTDQKGRA